MTRKKSYPAISVLLPVHNAERYLADAVQSILDQTFGDFELIAFDDGSTDASLSILDKFAAHDQRVRVFSRENRGLVATLNEMIELACGEYLARMDADDVCLPDRFANQLAFLQNKPQHVLVGGWVTKINERSQKIGLIQSPVNHAEIDQEHLVGNTSICHPTALMRKSAVVEVNGYEKQYPAAEDLDLWLRLAEIGQVGNIPEAVLLYRTHSGSISEAKGDVQQASMRFACESAWKRRGIDGKFNPDTHWRPGQDHASRHQFVLQYGWTAWANGYRDTWRNYAWQAIRSAPLSLYSWKLLVFGFLRRPKRQQ